MQYFAIGVAVVCFYAAALIRKWWKTALIFTFIIAVYLGAVFGVKFSRTLRRDWISRIDTEVVKNDDYLRYEKGSVKVYLDGEWYFLNQIKEFRFEYLNYWVILKDGTKHKVVDRSVIDFLNNETEKPRR